MQTDLLSYVEALTAPEVDRKAQLEATIERGMQTFVTISVAVPTDVLRRAVSTASVIDVSQEAA